MMNIIIKSLFGIVLVIALLIIIVWMLMILKVALEWLFDINYIDKLTKWLKKE